MKVKLEGINGRVCFIDAVRLDITKGQILIMDNVVDGSSTNPYKHFKLEDDKMYDSFFGILKTLWVDGEVVYENGDD